MQDKSPSPRERNPRRKLNKSRKLLFLYLLLGLIAVLLVFVLAYLPRVSKPPVRLPEMEYNELPQNRATHEGSSVVPKKPEQPSPTPGAKNGATAERTAFRRMQPRGTLIFIVDDVGNNLEELRPFLRFPGPLTLSIMPQRPYTLASYQMILHAGKVPMLHQPMEADGKENPGAGVIKSSMSKHEVDELLTKNLQGMPEITWVNNHMGSKATSNVDTMTYVLGYLKERGIHFLDSRTTPATAVKQAALRLGLPYYDRNSYFLDDKVDKTDIMRELDAGLRVAQRDGYAVMIGHVWDRVLPRLLIDSYPRLVSEGYEFADIRYLAEEARSNVRARN